MLRETRGPVGLIGQCQVTFWLLPLAASSQACPEKFMQYVNTCLVMGLSGKDIRLRECSDSGKCNSSFDSIKKKNQNTRHCPCLPVSFPNVNLLQQSNYSRFKINTKKKNASIDTIFLQNFILSPFPNMFQCPICTFFRCCESILW